MSANYNRKHLRDFEYNQIAYKYYHVYSYRKVVLIDAHQNHSD